jgi:hypothetical protein
MNPSLTVTQARVLAGVPAYDVSQINNSGDFVRAALAYAKENHADIRLGNDLVLNAARAAYQSGNLSKEQYNFIAGKSFQATLAEGKAYGQDFRNMTPDQIQHMIDSIPISARNSSEAYGRENQAMDVLSMFRHPGNEVQSIIRGATVGMPQLIGWQTTGEPYFSDKNVAYSSVKTYSDLYNKPTSPTPTVSPLPFTVPAPSLAPSALTSAQISTGGKEYTVIREENGYRVVGADGSSTWFANQPSGAPPKACTGPCGVGSPASAIQKYLGMTSMDLGILLPASVSNTKSGASFGRGYGNIPQVISLRA